MPTALITGASRGLGAAVARELAQQDWDLVLTGRHSATLQTTADEIRRNARVVAVAGDVTDAAHRAELARASAALGGLDVLMNNASDLGASPLPPLSEYPLDRLAALLDTNVIAPLALVQTLLAHLRSDGAIINVTSDAGAEAYPGWGGYGASKAALDQLSAVLAVELPHLRVYAFDPGDMRTQMHQDAFPGEDISDRPTPETVVPAVLRLVGTPLESGRYTATALLARVGAQS